MQYHHDNERKNAIFGNSKFEDIGKKIAHFSTALNQSNTHTHAHQHFLRAQPNLFFIIIVINIIIIIR